MCCSFKTSRSGLLLVSSGTMGKPLNLLLSVFSYPSDVGGNNTLFINKQKVSALGTFLVINERYLVWAVPSHSSWAEPRKFDLPLAHRHPPSSLTSRGAGATKYFTPHRAPGGTAKSPMQFRRDQGFQIPLNTFFKWIPVQLQISQSQAGHSWSLGNCSIKHSFGKESTHPLLCFFFFFLEGCSYLWS